MKTIYYLDGIEVNAPNNHEELSIQIAFDDSGSIQTVSVNNWEFGVADGRNSNDAVSLIHKQIDDGLVSGIGVLEGKPFKIDIDDERGNVTNIFDGYIDISSGKIFCDKIIAPAFENGGRDWFNEEADAVSFEYMFRVSGEITSTKWIAIPFVINKKQSFSDILITLLSLFVMLKAVKDELKEIEQLSDRTGYPITTIEAILEWIFQILSIIFLVVALVKIIIDLINYMVQPVRFHNGMYVKDLLQIGINKLGLQFSSTIFQSAPYNELVILPEKYASVQDEETAIPLFDVKVKLFSIKPPGGLGVYNGTLGDLLRSLIELFNLKSVIKDGVYHLEKQDFNLSSSTYTLPPTEDNGYTFNVDEFFPNYLLSFSVDFQDRNTISEYNGTAFQVNHTPININNKTMVLMKNGKGKKITSEFALGKRKTELTAQEKMLKEGLKPILKIMDNAIDRYNLIVDGIQAVFGVVLDLFNSFNSIPGININIPNNPSWIAQKLPHLNADTIISNRIDMLKMETAYVNVPKLLLLKDNSDPINNVLLPGNEEFLSAEYIFNNFHYFNNFVETNGWNNQHKNKDLEEIDFTNVDFVKVFNNTDLLTNDGRPARWIELNWNPEKCTATGKYKIREAWTSNLQIETFIPNR